MFENEVQTRAAISGTGILLGAVLVLARLPLLLLIGPVAIFFLGLAADPDETHAVWYGILHALGIFDLASLTDAEKENYAMKRHYFWFGEVAMAAILAAVFAVPAGLWLAGQAEITIAFIGAALVFLPLFVFLPKILRSAMKADGDAVIDAFGKNEQIRKVFWAVFVAVAGMMLAQVAEPGVVREMVGVVAGI